jgi:hypothetical protein
MAQVSSNLMAYDQIFLKIRDFMILEKTNSFKTNEERIEKYNQLLSEIYQGISGPMTKFDPYIKGEPPISSKINKFSKDLANDMNVIAEHVDYLVAKTINTFNLFSTEIENEKRYAERIASKAKILQMYTQSPSNDVVYLGDSFDNADQVDFNRVKINFNPHIYNGSFSLPIVKSRLWSPNRVSITSSDGFMGNNHQVIRSTSSDGTSSYRYIFESNPTISSVAGIMDSNPLTYFEYEALNVDRDSGPVNKNTVSDNEFSYVTGTRSDATQGAGSLTNWSNYDLTKPLVLTVVMESNVATNANSIDIVPYFGSSNFVKVNQIRIFKEDGTSEDILDKAIFIGSSFAPLTIESAQNYFYNKATVKFSERKILKVEVIFEQDSIQDIDIKHLYWKPNYPQDEETESPFYGLSRFNPDVLSRDIYEEVTYNKDIIIPPLHQPNKFKANTNNPGSIKVTLKKKPVVYNAYIITFDIDGEKVYFQNWTTDLNDPDRYIQWKESPDFEAPPNADDPRPVKYFQSESDANQDYQSVISFINGIKQPISTTGTVSSVAGAGPWTATITGMTDVQLLEVGAYITATDGTGKLFGGTPQSVRVSEITSSTSIKYTVTGGTPPVPGTVTGISRTNFVSISSSSFPTASELLNIINPAVEYITHTSLGRTLEPVVPITAETEMYRAKRLAIGIRDISVSYETYADQAEIVSTPYLFDAPVEAIMLSVETNIDNTFSNKININYYISADGSNWMKISPVQLDTQGIAEVIVFNKNIPDSYQIPGVAYLNSPKVPNIVNKIYVKIEMIKNKNTNITPLIYSYELIAKVKK